MYTLIGPDGRPYESETPGTLGGYKPAKIYGLLDCPAALRAIAKGGYVTRRVFFADEATAIAAGYRPCARCMPEHYRKWKAGQSQRCSAESTESQRRTLQWVANELLRGEVEVLGDHERDSSLRSE